MRSISLGLVLVLRLHAAIAYVNTGTGTADSSASTIATAATSHTAGNLIVCGVTWSGSSVTVSSVANTAGDTWAQAASTLNTSHASQRTDIWYAMNSAGNASDVTTATFSANATNRRIICNQYSGIATTSAFDVGSTGYTAAGTSVTSGNMSTSVAESVIFAFVESTGATTYTAGTNFTLRGSTIGGSGFVARSEDRILSSTGTYTASMSGSTSVGMILSTAVFKAPGDATSVKDVISRGVIPIPR